MKNKSALMWTGILTLVFVVVSVAGYIYRVDLMDYYVNSLGGHVLTDRPRADVAPREAKTVPGIDRKLLFAPDQAFLEKGNQLYHSTGTCFTCHGAEGKGDGAAAAALNPKPRNFHDPADKWVQGGKLSQIFRSITKGVPNTAMPAFDYLSAEDRLAMAHYVHSLNKDLPKDSNAELAALDEEFGLTKTKQLPVNVPIAVAEKKIVEENAAEVSALEKAEAFVRKDNSPEKNIFMKYVTDLRKALKIVKDGDKLLKNRNEFISAVTADPRSSGFKTSLVSADKDEVSAVLDYAKKLKSL